ncbi:MULTISPECIES: protein-glutamate methylesterase/protein-glutamine glutaminase [Novosphingobium]|uniref:Protein-glutamate methylesterase/protein-glutamine glutaminase n=1 Tax=Novosphingobium mathurense TaxID=428990 RepID=A0A1U6GS71_9SPHN|nr:MULTISPECIES: chemotaxis response regulator protein-glutamate methylesterase [Novosphingobium]CDO36994.1 Chemotaxis Response Regulator protein CheB-glutamate methylesterase [Novosphingobium sp. KN65.2]SLJ86385.1 two-component system, chemotaxis family, response regulator CheB [Novosphingobium mathurense]
MTIRVLIVDDSATMRAILMSRLRQQPDIEVVGAASNAAEGRAMIKSLDPDVVTLDIEMPGMNGLDFLEKIMTLRPTPVIIVSGATREGNEVTARALALGAVDCYSKYDPSGKLAFEDSGRLAGMIRQAAQISYEKPGKPASVTPAAGSKAIRRDARLIAVGSSTGGVEALQVLLRDFPEDCPPTVIVQHVNPRFAPAIARTLDQVCPAKVGVAVHDMPLRQGHVYLAAEGDHHLLVKGTDVLYAKLRKGEPISGHVPSVDALFHSVAQYVGAEAVGILLTGMGQDGAKGLLAMSQAGAHTVVQDESTCIVFGMPRAAISLGAARVVAPINRIAHHALSMAA